MLRWIRVVCVLSLWAVLACAGARAAADAFRVTVNADGATLGTASGNVSTVSDGKGHVTWTLDGGQFTPAPVPDAKVAWDDSILAGTGAASADGTVTVKDFTVTVEQTTGVDISYRFRLSITFEGGAMKTVSIDQLK